MAQVRAVDRTRRRDLKLGAALAAASAGGCLVCFAFVARPRGHLRDAATALVPKLVSVLVAAGILFQPVHWTVRAGGVFYFYNHAARICVALDGQRFVATQATTQSGYLLASSQRLQSVGPALLKIKPLMKAGPPRSSE